MAPADSLLLRAVSDADAGAVDAVQRACYPADALERIEAMRCHWRLSPDTCLAAVSGERVVAYLLSHPWIMRTPPPINQVYDALPERADGLYLHDLAILPAARRSGLAARLIEAVFAAARRRKLSRCSLISVQKSRGFWERFGFRVVTDVADEFFRDALTHYRDPGCRYMEAEIIC